MLPGICRICTHRDYSSYDRCWTRRMLIICAPAVSMIDSPSNGQPAASSPGAHVICSMQKHYWSLETTACGYVHIVVRIKHAFGLSLASLLGTYAPGSNGSFCGGVIKARRVRVRTCARSPCHEIEGSLLPFILVYVQPEARS